MDRTVTNAIRYFMDEWIPPVIRDSSWFMYPFFLYAYRGKNIETAMNFKSLVHTMTPAEYEKYYLELDTISRNRATDINSQCIERIQQSIEKDTSSLLDVGCGHGYLLGEIHKRHPAIALTGCDLKIPAQAEGAPYMFRRGTLEEVNFPEKSFDVVTCCHTLEHIPQLPEFIAQLVRLARKKLIIVVPCQRFFYYTLDEHVHFFQYKEQLTSLFPFSHFTCDKVWGDWYYEADIGG